MKVLKEWFVQAPWGKIGLISYGSEDGEPVLLVHGRIDSASTFIPLLNYLPDTYHYVAVDLPGSGLSDPFPIGISMSRYLFVIAVEIVLKHLDWKSFIYIGHSMGCEHGIFYNLAYPNRIKKIIHLDVKPSFQRLQVQDYNEYIRLFYEEYYTNYDKYNVDNRVFSKRQARDAIMKARNLTEEQAEIILLRNLIPIGEDKYRLSWDKRLRIPAPQNYPPEYYIQLFSLNIPPTLFIAATRGQEGYTKGKEGAEKIMTALCKLDNVFIVEEEGGHDVHVTNPDRVARHVREFLNKEFKVTSKL